MRSECSRALTATRCGSKARKEYTRVSDEEREERTFHFCPECGATVYFATSAAPELVGIPVGAFTDPAFATPTISVWEERKHEWVTLPQGIEHIA